MNKISLGGVRVLEVPPEGTRLSSERDATDLIAAAYGEDIDLISVPVARLHRDFFRLRSGVAGAFLQKMQNYGYRCAIVGDISAELAASSALRDFVYESNRQGQVLFVSGPDELMSRLVPR
jgi:hypothetical protein